MPITMKQVRAAISYIEPNPNEVIKLGQDALSHLEKLLEDKDTFLASKAAYAISEIEDPRAEVLLKKAAQSERAEVRIAVAAGARNLASPATSDLLISVLNDKDPGVRKIALKSVPVDASHEVVTKIQALMSTDSQPYIRQLSSEVLRRVTPP